MLNLKQTVFSLAIASVVAASSSNAIAQDSASSDLQAAIGRLEGTSVHLSANIDTEKPEADRNGGFKMGVMMAVTSGGGAGSKSFNGQVDVHLADDGAIAVATAKGLPQVKAMHGGGRSLFSQTYDSQPYDVAKLMSLMRGTLDLKGLTKEVSQAKRVRVSDGDGKKTYRVTLDGDFFDVSDDAAEGGGLQQQIMKQAMGSMKSHVMEGVFTLSVDGAGMPTSMKYVLQYNDPMKAMMGQAMAGGGAIRIGVGGKKPKDVPGEKIIVSYEVLSDSDGPAQEFAKEAAEMMESSAN